MLLQNGWLLFTKDCLFISKYVFMYNTIYVFLYTHYKDCYILGAHGDPLCCTGPVQAGICVLTASQHILTLEGNVGQEISTISVHMTGR